MVGLDAAGKTTILYKLKLGEIVTTIPTIGESYLSHQNVNKDVWRWCVKWSGVGQQRSRDSTSRQSHRPYGSMG